MGRLFRPVGLGIALSVCAIFWITLTTALFWEAQRGTAIAVLGVMVAGIAAGGLLLYLTRAEARDARAEPAELVQRRSPSAT
jgi:hypothetical protein